MSTLSKIPKKTKPRKKPRNLRKLRLEIPRKLRRVFAEAWRYKVIFGGRGSAKSWTIARILLVLAVLRPLRILCAREYQNSLDASVMQLLADQIEALGLSAWFTVGKRTITCVNGSKFVFAGLRKNISKIKSFEGADIVWVEEAQTISKASLAVLIPTIRKKGSELWFTFNPDLEEDEVWQMFKAWPRPDALVIEMNWGDNPWFPDELRTEKDVLKARDLDAYDNVWGGKCRKHVAGAIWTKEIFESQRLAAPADEEAFAAFLATLRRVVIAVDPSGCSGEEDKRADEIGIVAAGIRHDGTGVLLQDATGRYSPSGWANKTLELFDRWKADKIVAEKNFGGALVESNIRTARRTAPVKMVTASRGKVQRAEPVAAIYEQGKVRHLGCFPELERECCMFSRDGYMGPKSPNRADAMVWGFTELMLDPGAAPNIRFPSIERKQ